MIELQHVRKVYGQVTPLEDVSVTIHDGDVIAVIGPSGTGKSTLLRWINLLETPTSGHILVDGEDILLHCVRYLYDQQCCSLHSGIYHRIQLQFL